MLDQKVIRSLRLVWRVGIAISALNPKKRSEKVFGVQSGPRRGAKLDRQAMRNQMTSFILSRRASAGLVDGSQVVTASAGLGAHSAHQNIMASLMQCRATMPESIQAALRHAACRS